MRVGMIINPISGARRDRASIDRVRLAREFFQERSIDATIECSAYAGHAIELARAFVRAGMHRVVAWGGDGTVNEVAGPLIGTAIVLGLVPGGSGDGFARGIGVPADPLSALGVAVADPVLTLDVGWLGDRHFLNVAGFGFDAAVAEAFHRRAGRGLVGYVLAGIGCLWNYRDARYSIDLDGELLDGPRFLVAFANGREYGNGFTLAANADPRDGILDVVMVESGPIVKQIWRGRTFLLRKGMPDAGVETRRVRQARVTAVQLHAHVDGEPVRVEPPVRISVQPGALRLAAAPWPRA